MFRDREKIRFSEMGRLVSIILVLTLAIPNLVGCKKERIHTQAMREETPKESHINTTHMKSSFPHGEETPKAFYPKINVDIININTAKEEDLIRLPGIGKVKAGRIIAYREEHGRFKDVDQLIEVKGIGKKTLERIRPLISIEDAQ